MNRTPGVGIIIPVYNAEKTLNRALQSLEKQTYVNFKIFLINDGSKDASGMICDEFCKKHANAFVFHGENRGVSEARNFGLKVAEKECDYIMFMDADDQASPVFIEYAVRLQLDSPGNIIAWESTDNAETLESLPNYEQLKKTVYEKENMLDYYFTWNICPVWNKIFDSSVIREENLKFRKDLRISEDTVFVMEYIHHCFQRNPDCKIYLVHAKLYCYIQLDSGICKSIGTQYGLQQQKLMPMVICEFRKFYKLSEKQLAPLYHRYVQAIFMGFDNIDRAEISEADKRHSKAELFGLAMQEMLEYFRCNKIYSAYYLPLRFRKIDLGLKMFRSQNKETAEEQKFYWKMYWLGYNLLLRRYSLI